MSATSLPPNRMPTATPKPSANILTINGGSSSLKFAMFATADPPQRMASGRVERVGQGDARLLIEATDGSGSEDRRVDAPNQAAAAALVIDWLARKSMLTSLAAIGHRVVHGGGQFAEPAFVSLGMISRLHEMIILDPEHLPGQLSLLEEFGKIAPSTPQVACFDTAFHRELPRVARIVPIPRRYEGIGVRRYGFHGLSYTYLMQELARIAGPDEANGRVVLAHLGAGASLAAVRGGRCIDTTMGFTPASGLVMGTRAGDIDPGLVAFLARTEGMTPERFDRMVSRESGLLGISETSSDVRDLLAKRGSDIRAAEAVELFCYRVKKWIGSFAAALGGVDSLVFAGGIGENSQEIRREICHGLEFLGLELDEGRNAANLPRISTDSSRAAVRVIHTDEESVIARATVRLIKGTS
jgi:acetate kinase